MLKELVGHASPSLLVQDSHPKIGANDRLYVLLRPNTDWDLVLSYYDDLRSFSQEIEFALAWALSTFVHLDRLSIGSNYFLDA